MDNFIQHFSINTQGTDYAVGDIHGCFSLLQKELDIIHFDPAKDRLFCLGDLVDRGPESENALEWLDKPWFHSIRGNHEEMLIETDLQDSDVHTSDHFNNGGEWFYDLKEDDQIDFKLRFEQLPYIIQVQTSKGPVGLVHAYFPYNDWDKVRTGPFPPFDLYRCLWSRERIHHPMYNPINNVRAVIHGHTPVYCKVVIDNTYFIDTGGWLENTGHFTLLNLETLEPANPSAKEVYFAQ